MADKKRKDNKGRVLKKGESQRNNNTYMYRWTDGIGTTKSIYAKSLDELRQKEEEISKEMSAGVTRTSVTLNEQIELYLELKVGLANSTRDNYWYYYKHSIKDSRIGNMKVIDLRKTDIMRFYKSLTDNDYSVGTIKIVHKIIHPALQLACDDNIILKNPSHGCTKEYTDELEKKYALTIEEEQEFLDRVLLRPRMKRYYPMYAIMMKVGLRISELVGLVWDNVDMDKKEITIDHQVQYRRVNDVVQYYASDTKTEAGKRVIPMTDEVYKLFVEQRKVWLMTNKDMDFEVDGYKNFVFVSHVTGKCMNHNSIRRMMRNLVSMNDRREVQLPNVSPHILRHTALTRLAEAGCDIKVLQYLFGQTDVRTTMGVYNHIDSERVKREVDKLENLHRNLHRFTQKLTQNEEISM